MLRIKIRKVDNGYLVVFYRGFWEFMSGRFVAKSHDELFSVIQKKIVELDNGVDDF